MSSKFDVMQKLVQTYQDLASAPNPVEVRILNGTPEIRHVVARWNQRDLATNENRTIETLHQITKTESGEHAYKTLSTTDVSSELYSRYSPSERKKCVIRVVPDGGKKKQFLEIWENGRLVKNVDLSALNLHGDIYPPGEFGTVEWSPDELLIVYIAEKKRIKPEPFFSSKPQIQPENGEFPYGEEYTLIPDWGEQMTDFSQTTIVLYDMSNIHVLDVIPEGWCPGELVWNTTGDGFYGVAYKNDPRLGITYCTNRESHLFYYSLDGTLENNLTGSGLSVRSPRLRSDGEIFIWLQRPANGPHDSCYAMMQKEISTQTVMELVPIPDKEIPSQNGVFTGLNKPLTRRCFSTNGFWIFFTTVTYNKCVMFTVTVGTGSLTEHPSGDVLDHWDDFALGTRGAPNIFPYLYIFNNDTEPLEGDVTEQIIAVEADVQYITITSPVEGIDFDNFNIILLKPTSTNDKMPLIVFPHGGPHSVNYDTFGIEAAYFAKLGIAVLFVNYRGSLGSGQKGVESLLGNIGSLDVGDVQKAVEQTLSENENIDGNSVVIYGGSHGGYLALQLAGQYPDLYKSVVVRNPVVDLPTMFVTSDIPDWVSTEIGSTYNPMNLPTTADIQQMKERSPIVWIDTYKAPTLFLLGKNDRRVPMAQSLYYNRMLQARGIKTKVHIYPDNHALGTVPVHMDALINATFWIYESLGIGAYTS